MTKLKAVLRRIAKVPIPLLSYLLVWAVWLAVCAGHLAGDSVSKANGSLQTRALDIHDFAWLDMEQTGPDTLYTTTHDPRMIWDNTAGKVRTFRFAAEISDEGHEMCLYYTNPGDNEFSEHKRVWPVQRADGSYLFTLPRTNIEQLRLDAVSVKGLTLTFNGIWLNEGGTALGYFNPGVWGFVCLLFGPALLAAALRWLADIARYYTAKIKQNKKGA